MARLGTLLGRVLGLFKTNRRGDGGRGDGDAVRRAVQVDELGVESAWTGNLDREREDLGGVLRRGGGHADVLLATRQDGGSRNPSGIPPGTQHLNISDDGLDLIKHFEGLRLTAYDDGVGVWTIGYGHTEGVAPGDKITEHEAHVMLAYDVARFEDAVNTYVFTDLEQHEFDACVSLSFNIGEKAFRTSTLCTLLNLNRKDMAAEQFPRWNKAGGRVMKGLVKRRAAEQAMFLGGDWRDTL